MNNLWSFVLFFFGNLVICSQYLSVRAYLASAIQLSLLPGLMMKLRLMSQCCNASELTSKWRYLCFFLHLFLINYLEEHVTRKGQTCSTTTSWRGDPLNSIPLISVVSIKEFCLMQLWCTRNIFLYLFNIMVLCIWLACQHVISCLLSFFFPGLIHRISQLQNIEKIKKVVDEGNFYGAQQMYKSIGARYDC